jgi:hypothetical protein
MNVSDRWSVNLYITEVDSQTRAEARLAMPGGLGRLIGRGEARRNPADQEVSLIGEQIAAPAPCRTWPGSCCIPRPWASRP